MLYSVVDRIRNFFLDPAKSERADKWTLTGNFKFSACEFWTVCTVGLKYVIENGRQLINSYFWWCVFNILKICLNNTVWVGSRSRSETGSGTPKNSLLDLYLPVSGINHSGSTTLVFIEYVCVSTGIVGRESYETSVEMAMRHYFSFIMNSLVQLCLLFGPHWLFVVPHHYRLSPGRGARRRTGSRGSWQLWKFRWALWLHTFVMSKNYGSGSPRFRSRLWINHR